MARIPEIARGKIYLAQGIHCCPNFLFYLGCPTSVSIFWRICIYLRNCDSVQIVYQVQLLTNNTACESFLHKSGALRSVDWIFITRAAAWPWLGHYVTLDNMFYKPRNKPLTQVSKWGLDEHPFHSTRAFGAVLYWQLRGYHWIFLLTLCPCCFLSEQLISSDKHLQKAVTSAFT